MENRIVQEQEITKQLRIVFKAVQAHSKRVEKTCGLSSAKLWMLHEIASTHGIKVSQLATALSIHRSTCSNMLDKLEEKGLISRDRSKTDQRTVHLYVTALGFDLLKKAPIPHQGQLSSALKRLSPQQLIDLDNSLKDFINALYFDDEKAGLIPIPDEE